MIREHLYQERQRYVLLFSDHLGILLGEWSKKIPPGLWLNVLRIYSVQNSVIFFIICLPLDIPEPPKAI